MEKEMTMADLAFEEYSDNYEQSDLALDSYSPDWNLVTE
jgi:hypothetical protein